ncbi:MAG: patatin-like phospholipase family protein [Alphaproteobacteria bacterium]|nr:patatin-like phospholipase family protein [Alphaproteobacteria bacterium]
MTDVEGDKEDINRDQSEKPQQTYSSGIGLALGGGVARGFAHIGVLNVLDRHGIKPSIITGTSIGAIVGACYLAGKLRTFEDWACSLNRMRILSYLDFHTRSASMIGGRKLRRVLEANFKDMQIEDLPCPFLAIAADLSTGHEVWMRKGNIVDAITASYALPGVFPPVERNHRLLIDGALVNPVPVAPALAMGARMTIAVDLNADIIGKAVKPGNNYQTVAGFDLFDDNDVPPSIRQRFVSGMTKRIFGRQVDAPSLFGVMVSALNIVQDRITRSRLAGDPPDIHIKPKIGDIGMLEFERAEELIARGEEAAVRALPKIKDAMQVLLPPEYQKKP